MVCVFKHLSCSAQLSMSSMEKRYRNKSLLLLLLSITQQAIQTPSYPSPNRAKERGEKKKTVENGVKVSGYSV